MAHGRGGIEAMAFHRLPDDAWAELAVEARALTAVLATRQPIVYGRYAHWWAKLPYAEVRLCPALPDPAVAAACFPNRTALGRLTITVPM